MGSEREAVFAAFAGLRAAADAVSAVSFDALATGDLLTLLDALQLHRRRQPTVEHDILNELTGASHLVRDDAGSTHSTRRR
jgi:hypothetical protein